MRRRPYIRPGDHLVVSDRSGREIWASDSRREWNGSIVHKDEWEPRHPQDSVRGVADHQAVPNPRPPPIPAFIGPLTTTITADTGAGATTLPVVFSERFFAGDTLNISLDNGELFRPTVAAVPSATSLTITPALPWRVGADRLVVNVSAISPADVG